MLRMLETVFRPSLRPQLSCLPLCLVFIFLYGLVMLYCTSHQVDSLLSADVSGALGFPCYLSFSTRSLEGLVSVWTWGTALCVACGTGKGWELLFFDSHELNVCYVGSFVVRDTANVIGPLASWSHFSVLKYRPEKPLEIDHCDRCSKGCGRKVSVPRVK